MLYVPFVFFSCLLFRIIKKYGIGISACMTGSYALSAFSSIILYHIDYDYALVDFGRIKISVIPTIVYCALLYASIYPFIGIDAYKQKSIKPIKNKECFYVLSTIFIVSFFLLIVLFYKKFLFNLMFGNLGELRVDSLNENKSVTEELSGISRFVATPLIIIGNVAYFAIPLFFYHLCVQSKKKLFNTLLLISSLSPVFLGVLYVDRSKTFYWVMLFIMSFFWFRKYIRSDTQKNFVKQLGFVVLGVLLIYFAAVTISRFGERDIGSEGGLIIYAGQPFLNFVNLWDNYNNPVENYSHILPIFNYLFWGNLQMGEWYDIAYSKSGMHINVFFTYLGLFLTDIGKTSVFVAALFVNRLSILVVKHVRGKQELCLSNTLLLFAVAIIVQCGVISYFYASLDRFLGVIFILAFCIVFYKSKD